MIGDNWRKISARERGELESRGLLSDETWIGWKQDYDELMSYRKSIKGKPTAEQRLMLHLNKIFIDFYERLLFHAEMLGGTCVCARCKDDR